jgi:hypothetical protein
VGPVSDVRTGAVSAYPFDARPLIEPVDPRAARAFRQELQRTGRAPAGLAGTGIAAAVVVIFVVFVFGSVFVGLITAFVGILASVGGSGPEALVALLPLVVVAGIAAVIVVVLVRGRRRNDERAFRLDRFARANAMAYVPHVATPPLPGMIFSIGSSRRASDLVRGERPRFVEFGNYRYVTGSGKNRTTHAWGYAAVKLDVPLPHIVLDATSNNSLFGSNLPATFDKDQRLSLEGDFDRFFSLYCPAGYERDALYLFTPDIMARFIDNAAALDVEIVDDWLFLYAKRDFTTLDPATWAWLFSVVGALLDKLAQWARWRDERLRIEAGAGAAPRGADPVTASAVPFTAPLDALRPPPGVAPQGRRLQRGVPWASVVIVGIVVVYWLLSQFGVWRFFGG